MFNPIKLIPKIKISESRSKVYAAVNNYYTCIGYQSNVRLMKFCGFGMFNSCVKQIMGTIVCVSPCEIIYLFIGHKKKPSN